MGERVLSAAISSFSAGCVRGGANGCRRRTASCRFLGLCPINLATMAHVFGCNAVFSSNSADLIPFSFREYVLSNYDNSHIITTNVNAETVCFLVGFWRAIWLFVARILGTPRSCIAAVVRRAGGRASLEERTLSSHRTDIRLRCVWHRCLWSMVCRQLSAYTTGARAVASSAVAQRRAAFTVFRRSRHLHSLRHVRHRPLADDHGLRFSCADRLS